MTEATFQADEALDIGKARLAQVFDYLHALDQLRNPVCRIIEQQPWRLWLRDLPSHPSICRGVVREGSATEDAGDDFILRVGRPPITYGPPVPTEIQDWVIVTDRGEPESAIEVRESINTPGPNGEAQLVRLDEDPHRVSALKNWRQRWDQWSENERPTRRALEIFERMYALHGQLQREGERLELVLGDGVLHWRRPEGRIHHPLLLQRLQLEFVPKRPEFILRETDHPVELYSAVFRGLDDVDGAALAQSQQELEAGLLHPLGGSATSGFLRKLVARLSALGQYLDDPTTSSGATQPEIYRDPVLFVRPRTLGFASALEAVREDLHRRQELPVSLLNIMGIEASPANEHQGNPVWLGPANEVEDVLLSKPANPEQVQIAHRLEQYGAVLVQGPPGTGKTHTIANLIGHLLAQGKSVLVTSHTSKALRVLHRQVVGQLQPLCVSVLGSDAENREALERAVAGIADRLSSDADELEAAGKRLEIERAGLLRRIGSARQALLDCVGSEYREVVVAEKAYPPSLAARLLAQGVQSEDWIPGPVEPGAPLPLSSSEIQELYRTNTAITPGDENEIDTSLPTPNTLPSPTAFARLVSDEAVLRAMDRTTGSKQWSENPPAPGLEVLERLLQEAEVMLETLVYADEWKLALIQAGRLGGAHRQVWDDLSDALLEWSDEGAECERLIAVFGPELPNDDHDLSQEQVLDEILAHVAGGGRLGTLDLLFHPEWKRLLAEATVDGRPASRLEHFRALRALARIKRIRHELRARWDRLMQPIGGPMAQELTERPEQSAVRLREIVLGGLNWKEHRWTAFEAQLIASGFDWPALLHQVPPDLRAYGDLMRLRRSLSENLLPALHARMAAARLHVQEAQFTVLSDQLLRAAGESGSVLVHRLRGTVEARDVQGYEDVFTQLVDLHAHAPTLDRRRTLLRPLETVAPGWSCQIRSRMGIHSAAEPPGDVESAWRWRQLAQELERRTATSPTKLQREIEDLRCQLEQVTTELIDRRAWAAQIRRVGVAQRQALVGWLQTVRRIGKGTGKRAPQLLAQARRQMVQCRGAVPVWVMPLARVVENFDPRAIGFDVVVIDEASQSDVMALVALYLGRQVLIVGDEEQVSPDAVGQNLTAVGQLIAQYLRDVPNGHLYDGQTSIYDLAKASFGGSICLREHFRCVPEIIQFSNALCYDGRLKPLRDGSGITIKPPLAAHRVRGYDTSGNVNHEEAITIGTLIAAAIEQPEYDNATFGMISLVGEQQALEVDRLLRMHLPPVEYERRRIVCGNPAQFQGDERDVIFLSVVDGPRNGPLPMREQPRFKKRFNVAASRARDQMWVVHSLSPAVDLKPADLRRRLIQHALDPSDLMQRLEDVEQRAESEFERQVARRLVTAGFSVVPQWRVGYYRIDLVVVGGGRRLAVECDGDRFHALEKLPQDMERQAILERRGWRFVRIRGSEYFRDPDGAMRPVFERLAVLGVTPEDTAVAATPSDGDELRDRVIRRAAEIRREWEAETCGPSAMQTPADQSRASTSTNLKPEPAAQSEKSDTLLVNLPNSRTVVSQATYLPAAIHRQQAEPRGEPTRSHHEKSDEPLQEASDQTGPPTSEFDGRNAIEVGSGEPIQLAFDLTAPGSGCDAIELGPGEPLDLPAFFRSRGIPWRDNRNKPGGSFWVTGGPELDGLMRELKRQGIDFRFTQNGSRATRYKPGWFLPPS